jgi:hypothetical protein
MKALMDASQQEMDTRLEEMKASEEVRGCGGAL